MPATTYGAEPVTRTALDVSLLFVGRFPPSPGSRCGLPSSTGSGAAQVELPECGLERPLRVAALPDDDAGIVQPDRLTTARTAERWQRHADGVPRTGRRTRPVRGLSAARAHDEACPPS